VKRPWAPALILLAFLAGCERGHGPSVPAEASLSLRLSMAGDDRRVFSVGSVQLRAFDLNFGPHAFLVAPADRETGRFDVDFDVPAGELRILVEPRGSALLPDGGKTESGVAMQALSDPILVKVGEVTDLELALVPFIPDSLRIAQTPKRVLLVWKAMPPAESHTLRAIGETGETLVPVEEGQDFYYLDDVKGIGTIRAVQVRSENRFSSSAFSDTLFLRIGGGS